MSYQSLITLAGFGRTVRLKDGNAQTMKDPFRKFSKSSDQNQI